MIQFIPTKHGTGVKIIGDYGDLRSLHSTFQKLMLENQNISCRERTRLLSVMSYEIRHACQHDRLCEERNYDSDNTVTYYGCYIDWVTLLFSIACLRYNAAYVILDEMDQANLYILEYWCKNAMERYDRQGFATLQYFIDRYIPAGNDLIYHLHQYAVNEFYNTKTGKNRFRKLPELISKYCNQWGEYYKAIEMDWKKTTADGKTTVCDYESNFPDVDVVW